LEVYHRVIKKPDLKEFILKKGMFVLFLEFRFCFHILFKTNYFYRSRKWKQITKIKKNYIEVLLGNMPEVVLEKFAKLNFPRKLANLSEENFAQNHEKTNYVKFSLDL